MKSDFEYIVIGLGGLGSAAAFWLSTRKGKEVLGLEQFELGHIHGESQDHSRIIRLSYHTPAYVALAQEAYDAWNALETILGEKLIVRTGGLDLWPFGAMIPMSDYTDSLSSCGVQFELLNANEIRKRFPAFALPDHISGLYQSQGGIVPAARCNLAHQELARQQGATLLDCAPVLSILRSHDHFQVVTKNRTYGCHKLILANGPWTNQMLSHFGMRLPLTVTQEQVTYFLPQQMVDFAPDRFPVWIWMDEPSFYGFPLFGEAAVKIGQDCGGREVTPATRTYDPDEDALQRVQDFLRKFLPGAAGNILYTKSCLYTLTPDRDFVIDALPGVPNCYTAIGAGHAFKFASLIGRILTDLAVDGKTSSDIEPFRITRPVLQEANPTKHWMV
ncbi:MAG TPA: N-methyl-L-tryptophan oxidase [Acidobacteriota bacterium]